MFAEYSLASVTLGKGFSKCKMVFAEYSLVSVTLDKELDSDSEYI